jgi:hypothetical protein
LLRLRWLLVAASSTTLMLPSGGRWQIDRATGFASPRGQTGQRRSDTQGD